jgi:hypothetical protein
MVPLLNRQVASRASVQPARLQLPLLDPQVARELGIISAYLLDEALGILAAKEGLDGVPGVAGLSPVVRSHESPANRGCSPVFPRHLAPETFNP